MYSRIGGEDNVQRLSTHRGARVMRSSRAR